MAKPSGFSVLTTCRTVEDFIEQFHRRSTKTTIFVPYLDDRLFGSECAFAILLSNRRPVLAGTCVVADIFADTDNEYGHRGMRLLIERLGPDSQQIWTALEAARELGDEPDTLVKPPRAPMGTRDVPQLVLGDGTRESPRAPSPSFVVPTNPFTDLTDAGLEGIVDCRLYENVVVADDLDDADTLVKKR